MSGRLVSPGSGMVEIVKPIPGCGTDGKVVVSAAEPGGAVPMVTTKLVIAVTVTVDSHESGLAVCCRAANLSVSGRKNFITLASVWATLMPSTVITLVPYTVVVMTWRERDGKGSAAEVPTAAPWVTVVVAGQFS